jgi:hypothetical protein
MTDDLIAILKERSQRLRQLAAGSPATENTRSFPEAQKNVDSPEIFSVENSSKLLTKRDNADFSPFLHFPEDRTQTHPSAGVRACGRARAFNSIYSFRNRGETEKNSDYPRNFAKPDFSVPPKSNVDFYVKAGEAAVCCVCDKPIDSVDTFWGADPAHRPCAEAAFLANKAAGQYRP